MGQSSQMKTTLEIPDKLFRKIKATAASSGSTIKQLVTEALEEKIFDLNTNSGENTWTNYFGTFNKKSELSDSKKMNELIKDEFSQIDLNTWK